MKEPLLVIEPTWVFVKPEFTPFQLAPLSVERNIPPPLVPAKILLPLAASEKTYLFVKPEETAIQFAPLSVEK